MYFLLPHSFRQSFKLKKRLDRPQEEWKIFPDTHPAIIDRETFALIQDLRQHRRRPDRTGIVSMFSGLLYCADCGEKLYYNSTNNGKREGAFFFCSSYRKNSDVCSTHFIRKRIVEQLVLEGLQRLMWYVQVYEKKFAQEQMERFGVQEKKTLAEKRRDLDKAKQWDLKGRIPELEDSLKSTEDKNEDLQKSINRAKRITRLTELTPEIVHEFIEKIVVSKPENSTIGLWVAPEPETLEQEYMACYQAMQKRKRKTA